MTPNPANPPAPPAANLPPPRLWRGLIVAAIGFVLIGTATALWQNPFFTRMTPVSFWELPSALLVAGLGGVYAAVALPICGTGGAGGGGIVSFIGIACPTCNKVLMAIFGGQALLTYFDPIRPLVTLAGILLLVWALGRALRLRSELARALPALPEAVRA